MTIPDEVVREAWKAWVNNPENNSTGPFIAALEVAVKWAREDQKEKDAELCKPQPDEAWEKDAVWAGNYIASRIRNQKD